MKLQFKIAIPVAFFGLLLFAPFAHGQRGGGHGSGGGFRGGSAGGFRSGALRGNRGGEFGRQGRQRFENGFGFPFGDGYGFPFAPFYYPDYFYSDYYDSDLDYTDPAPLDPPIQPRPRQVYRPPAPPPVPGDPLILENHDGQWVRIPTGGEMANGAVPQSADPESTPSPKAHGAAPKAVETEPPSPPLPPAVLVFRDGHTEEVQKYMIQGSDLYVTSPYSTTGSWIKKIPLADLDIPASLKINKDRGTKFNLPSGPNEVVVRF